MGETIAQIGEGGGGSSDDDDEEDDEERRGRRGRRAEDEGDEERRTRPPRKRTTGDEEEPDDESDEDDDESEEDDEEPESEEDEEPTSPKRTRSPSPSRSPSEDDGERVKASPIARRMASEKGLDLSEHRGQRPGRADRQGRRRGRDQGERARGRGAAKEERGAQARARRRAGRGEIEHVELSRLQRTVARRMAESKATAPDFVMTLEVDMDEAVDLRGQLKAAAGDAPAPSFNDFVIKAAALALQATSRAPTAPTATASSSSTRASTSASRWPGQDALVVPTVFDADKKSLGTIAAEARRLAERVREGKITPPELSAGTFTISNLGMYGIRRFVAVINPPQAAILAVGELTPRPVVRDGEVVDPQRHGAHAHLRPPDPLRRRRRRVPGRIREYLEKPLKLASDAQGARHR